MIAFEDLVGDAGERAGDALGVEDNGHEYLFASSQGRVKENDDDYISTTEGRGSTPGVLCRRRVHAC
jgi:hypothetical protein